MELVRAKGYEPLYHQLESVIKEKIQNGDYAKGDIIPSEKELMKTYGVSRITVRQALSDLASDGYIEGRPGIGTVVTFEKINETLKRVISFSEEMAQHNITMSTVFCTAEKKSVNKEIAAELGMEEGALCLCIIRVRSANGIPIVYSMTWIPPEWDLPSEADCYMDSLYAYLRENKGIIVSSAVDTLEAVLADRITSEFLHVAENSALFKRSRKSFDSSGKALEFSICYYPGQSYKYSVEL